MLKKNVHCIWEVMESIRRKSTAFKFHIYVRFCVSLGPPKSRCHSSKRFIRGINSGDFQGGE